MNLSVYVAWELQSLEALVTLCYSHLSRPGIESRTDPMVASDGRLTEFTVVAGAAQMLLECAVQQTNNLIDGILLVLANGIVGEPSPQELIAGQRRPRKKLEALIADHIGGPLDALDGWDVVQRVREDANALKHRLGVTMEVNHAMGIVDASSVQLTEAEVVELIAGVRRWLHAVIYECGRSNKGIDADKPAV